MRLHPSLLQCPAERPVNSIDTDFQFNRVVETGNVDAVSSMGLDGECRAIQMILVEQTPCDGIEDCSLARLVASKNVGNIRSEGDFKIRKSLEILKSDSFKKNMLHLLVIW